MAYEVETHDGIVVRNIPDDIKPDDPRVMDRVAKARAANGGALATAPPVNRAPIVDNLNAETLNPTGSFGENVLHGAGKSLVDTYHGIKQIGSKVGNELGLVSDATNAGVQADVDESARLNKPLNSTGGGVTGNVLGTIAQMLLPAGALKGAGALAARLPGLASAAPALTSAGTATGAFLNPTSLVGAARTGALMGGVGPVTSEEGELGRLKNAGIGAAGGLAGNLIGKAFNARSASTIAADQSRNSVRDATMAAAREAGYVIPPSAGSPSWLARRLESVAGKAAIGQEAAVRNQGTTNQLVRRGLGMADDAPISTQALEAIRATEGRAYRNVAGLSRDAEDALQALRQARADTNLHFTHYGRSGDPAALTRAQNARTDAQLWEQFLEHEANAAGRADLIPALREARTRIAKTHDVGRALNTSTGEVDAHALGKMVDRGRPLTGELETAARFADAFPQYAREGLRIPTPGVSKSEALSAALLAAAGGAAGGPAGLAAGALPLMAGPVRSMLLSRPAQRMLTPNYDPGMLASPMAQRLLETARRAGGPVGAAAALEFHQ